MTAASPRLPRIDRFAFVAGDFIAPIQQEKKPGPREIPEGSDKKASVG